MAEIDTKDKIAIMELAVRATTSIRNAAAIRAAAVEEVKEQSPIELYKAMLKTITASDSEFGTYALADSPEKSPAIKPK